ncbi:LmbE family protein [Hymenobacter roseosalivarius DSM 11622]|uniref:LmbE family protein n=1 Tax=Hymenobacter roseosalivarius DSM 11622 TaxID=645990 RepID=A0A1W1V2D0_9BACT|nr:PIG-L deacetylase family protein [Hymenobacter roseosalivarius]SMB87509.1 LmbE family protein [Hymenobacter roseosalivarius DSM 11622]
MLETSPFSFVKLPLRPAEFAPQLGPTVVIAPHPDDESLGCGGLLALLCQARVPVMAILVTDGTMSHPNSQKYPPAARRHLREAEFEAALVALGILKAPHYLGLPDGNVPTAGAAGFEEAAEQLRIYISQFSPTTIVAPWRRDPHPDHRATSQLVRAALAQLAAPPRLLEYVVWAWERAAPPDLPQPGEVEGWCLDITSVLDQKQQAIAAHRSQLTNLIDDDPTGFQLSPAMLAHFAQPFEVYLEVKSESNSALL